MSTQIDTPRSSASTWLAALSLFVACVTAGYVIYSKPTPALTLESHDSTLDRVKRDGRLKAGFVVNPPFVTRDPNTKELSGYFIEIMNRIATEAKFEVDYEETNWGTMVAGLQTGQFDVVVSAIFATIPRAREVTFIEPVLYIGLSGVTRAGDNRIQLSTDLAKPDITIAFPNGGAGQEYVKANLPNAKVVVTTGSDITRPMLEVIAERADVALIDSLTGALFAKQHPEVKLVFTSKPLSIFAASFMVRRQDLEWKDFLDIAIHRLETDGTREALDAKYKENPSTWLTKRRPWQQEGPNP